MLVAVDVEAASNSIVPLISMVHYAILFLALFLVDRLSQAVSRSGVPVLAAQDAPARSRSFWRQKITSSSSPSRWSARYMRHFVAINGSKPCRRCRPWLQKPYDMRARIVTGSKEMVLSD